MNKSNNAIKFQLAILLLILLVVSTSCQTCPPSAAPIEVIEYRDRPMPVVNWPTFPDPEGQVERMPDGRIVMTLTYWLAVTRYVIDAEAGIEIIEISREAGE